MTNEVTRTAEPVDEVTVPVVLDSQISVRVEHEQFPGFIERGTVDVDAGCIWIGDPCYILDDRTEGRKKDLGADWHEFCDRIFERDGYRAMTDEAQDYSFAAERAWCESEQFRAALKDWPKDETLTVTPRHQRKPDHVMNALEEFIEKLRVEMETFKKDWKEKNPFVSTAEYTGVAQFNHDLGHAGLGVVVSSGYGDGSYPVYVRYEGGRPMQVLIDFGYTGDDSMEGSLEIQVSAMKRDGDGSTLARPDELEFWDITVRRVHWSGGQVDILEEFEDLPSNDLVGQILDLLRLRYPGIDAEWVYA